MILFSNCILYIRERNFKNILSPILCVFFLSCSGISSNERADNLRAKYLKIENDRVIAWFPKDSIDHPRMKEITDSLNLIVSVADDYFGQQDWQKFRGNKINYFFEEGKFVSFASEQGNVFVPLWRIKEMKAPLLHETMHVLLRSKKGNWDSESRIISFFYIPQWLTEGTAEYFALKISHESGLPNFDVQKGGGYLKVDSTCYEILKKEEGKYVVDYIGEEGAMLKLFTSDRKTYGSPFYNCSCSFTKYIGEKYGKEVLLKSISEVKNEQETIERLTNKELPVLKNEWLLDLDKRFN